jgi:protease I
MNKKVAILATNGFEEIELTSPRKALNDAGIATEIVSLESGRIKAWDKDNWSASYDVDKTVKEVSAADYTSLFLPGGVINPDTLRQSEDALTFIKSFFEAGKPVSAICHGVQPLIDAGVLKGRKLTSYPSVKQDVINAGGNWVDEEVVVDAGFTTSRSPEDLEAFNKKIVEEVKEGKHDEQHA